MPNALISPWSSRYAAAKYLALPALHWLLGLNGSSGIREHVLMLCAEIRQGLSTESRLTGATSNSPDQSQQAGWGTLLQRQEAGEHEQEVTIP